MKRKLLIWVKLGTVSQGYLVIKIKGEFYEYISFEFNGI